MLDGSAVYHDGVLPAANSDAIWLETAAELVRASATRDDGRAVSRTERRETLPLGLVLLRWSRLLVRTYRSSDDDACGAAKADAARAETARALYCILSKVSMYLV